MEKNKLCENCVHWKRMSEEIDTEREEAEELWGFKCLKDSTNLKWDIGDEVYFAWHEGEIFKGIIESVNIYGMYQVSILPKVVDIQKSIYINGDSIFKNVRYALVHARYNECKCREKENKK